MDVARRKITVKVTYNAPSTSSRPPSRTSSPRPPSPPKHAKSPTEGSATFRPKAKVNSSAAIRRSPSVVSAVASGTQRAGSPTKTFRAQSSTLSPSFQPRVTTATTTASKVTIRPQTPVSAPNTPDVRSRNLSPGSEVGRNTSPRVRDGSSLHHAMSFSSLQTAAQDRNENPSIRIRSKVSNLSNVSKPLNQDAPSPSPTPTAPAQIRASKTFNDNMLSSNPSAPAQMRVRSPSTSSSVSQIRNTAQTPPPLYPITTGSPAANPHRFGQRSPPNQQHAYQGLAINNPNNHQVNARPRINSTARVSLSSIPPPPTSPPGSTVSFSSRSSHSHSSSQGDNSLLDPSPLDGRPVSSATELWTPSDFGSPRSGFPVDEPSAPASAVDFLNDEERKVKAEAKSNRKMADLEITNRSLLSINSSLEATKNKQAKEIRDLRRKLRETRLILPPRAYREYKSSVDPEEEAAVEEEEEEEDSEVEEAAEGNGDEIYKRVKLMLEGLISSGKKALETTVEDFVETKGVAKVLTAEEVKSWHRSNDSGAGDDDNDSDTDSMSVSQGDISITCATNGEDDSGEDEDADTSILSHFFTGRPAGPPIHISEAA